MRASILAVSVLALAVNLVAAEKAKPSKEGDPIRIINGKRVDFTEAIRLNAVIKSQVGSAADPAVKAAAEKRKAEARRLFRPWENMLVEGRIEDTSRPEGLTIVKQSYGGELVAVKNAPFYIGIGDARVSLFAERAGTTRYGSNTIKLFDYGTPVPPASK